jgi:hypothetical protein
VRRDSARPCSQFAGAERFRTHGGFRRAIASATRGGAISVCQGPRAIATSRRFGASVDSCTLLANSQSRSRESCLSELSPAAALAALRQARALPSFSSKGGAGSLVPPTRPLLGEQQPSRVTLRCRGAVSSVPGPGEERGGPSEETRISRWLRTGTTGSAPAAVVAAAGRSPVPGAGTVATVCAAGALAARLLLASSRS